MKDSKNSEEHCEFNIEDVDYIPGFTRKIVFGCGNMYLTVNEVTLRPIRVFIRIGKSGCCQRALLEAIGRLVTIMLERGDPLDRVIHTLVGIRCAEASVGSTRHKLSGEMESCSSCMDALAKELKEYNFPKPESVTIPENVSGNI